MNDYILNFKISTVPRNPIHSSWCEICEKQTKDEIIGLLKKHLYDPGEYVLYFSAVSGFVIKHQASVMGQILRKSDSLCDHDTHAGFVDFAYYDDTFENYDFKTAWPEIDCSKELADPSARFTVAVDNITPSPAEFEITCQKSVDRFIKRIYDSVSFPLEIACDYPDVIFEVCYEGVPNGNLSADTLKVIEDYVKKYNKRHDTEIHYVADVTDIENDKKENAVYIHVDFGNCDINALALVVKAIGKSDLPIKELVLK